MKYLKKYNEISSYKNLHGDDAADITEVTPDKYHQYERCDGVLYELSNTGNNVIVYVSDVQHTEENTFYQDQIDRYVEYIEDGGILETFPVQEISKADNLDEMLSYIENEKDGFDIVNSLFKGNPWDKNPKPENKKMYDIYMSSGGLSNIQCDPEEYGFNDEYAPTITSKRGFHVVDFKQIKTEEDLIEAYHDYSDEEPNKEDFKDEDDYNVAHEEWEEKTSKYDEDILQGLIDIIKYFEDEKEYHLTDFNHRFAALKELGKKRVYVEIIK